MSDLEARRETEETHQCVCFIVEVRDGQIVGGDKCLEEGLPMDQAFCNDCERVGHHRLTREEGQHAEVPTRR